MKWQDDNFGLYESHIPTSTGQKLLIAASAALAGLRDPERADQVAALGDTTVSCTFCIKACGHLVLSKIPIPCVNHLAGVFCPEANPRSDAKRSRRKQGDTYSF